MKEKLKALIESYRQELTAMSDQIFDYAEPGLEEEKSSALLVNYLQEHGFTVETGIAQIPTAFRAVYEQGEGGPSLGLLCEYDALKDIGHACGHHTQGPCMIGAAMALRELLPDKAFKLVIYGTPAEETVGGKILMQERGCFTDIDVALMMHPGPNTQVDIKCMALEDFVVTFHGVETHAAMSPFKGKSAMDAVILSFNGIEFLREHVLDDSRMHYTVLDAGGPPNVVPGRAVAEYTLRSYDTDYLKNVLVPRFLDIIKGAALMSAVTYDIEQAPSFKAKIPVLKLNALVMENAKYFGAPQIAGPRERTGSTDFGNVMYHVPGTCIRMAFVPEGTSAHSKEYLEAGKSEKAHNAVVTGAEIIAGTCIDLLENPEKLAEIQAEFKERKAASKF